MKKGEAEFAAVKEITKKPVAKITATEMNKLLTSICFLGECWWLCNKGEVAGGLDKIAPIFESNPELALRLFRLVYSKLKKWVKPERVAGFKSYLRAVNSLVALDMVDLLFVQIIIDLSAKKIQWNQAEIESCRVLGLAIKRRTSRSEERLKEMEYYQQLCETELAEKWKKAVNECYCTHFLKPLLFPEGE